MNNHCRLDLFTDVDDNSTMMFPSLKFKPSDFFTNFSVSEIINQFTSASGLICARGSMGTAGMGNSHGDNEKAHYRKHDSYSCYIKEPDKERFDQAELIRELREKTELEIQRTGAKVTGSHQFTFSSFYLEYTTENITGRIEINSDFQQENSFQIKVSFDETSSNQKLPVVERTLPVYQPTASYHVVAFVSDDTHAREFYEKARRASRESEERFRQEVLAGKDNFNPEDYRAVMYMWTRTSEEVKEKLKDHFNAFIELPVEYDAFDKVYFLNELALKMYREAGEKFEVIKFISAEEMARLLERPSFQGYYVPKASKT